jgi:hypothetical protein
MEAIERLLRGAGERVVYATRDGQRVRPDVAYAFRHIEIEQIEDRNLPVVYLVECAPEPGFTIDETLRRHSRAVSIDHHRPGDPGYGRPPAEFLPASSIGQVLLHLLRDCSSEDLWGYLEEAGYWVTSFQHDSEEERLGLRPDWHYIPGRGWRLAQEAGIIYAPDDVLYTAAADHCLAAAYRGECPDVDPDTLMRWRVRVRAQFQGRPEEELLADVKRARVALRAAPEIDLDHRPSRASCPQKARDMRGKHMPELPEASAREGLCFVADGLPGPDGRVKVVCQSGTPEQIRAFMQVWGPEHGLTGIYGDPMRGFAGGYTNGPAA